MEQTILRRFTAQLEDRYTDVKEMPTKVEFMKQCGAAYDEAIYMKESSQFHRASLKHAIKTLFMGCEDSSQGKSLIKMDSVEKDCEAAYNEALKLEKEAKRKMNEHVICDDEVDGAEKKKETACAALAEALQASSIAGKAGDLAEKAEADKRVATLREEAKAADDAWQRATDMRDRATDLDGELVEAEEETGRIVFLGVVARALKRMQEKAGAKEPKKDVLHYAQFFFFLRSIYFSLKCNDRKVPHPVRVICDELQNAWPTDFGYWFGLKGPGLSFELFPIYYTKVDTDIVFSGDQFGPCYVGDFFQEAGEVILGDAIASAKNAQRKSVLRSILLRFQKRESFAKDAVSAYEDLKKKVSDGTHHNEIAEICSMMKGDKYEAVSRKRKRSVLEEQE